MGFVKPNLFYSILYSVVLSVMISNFIFWCVAVSYYNDGFYSKLFIKGDTVFSVIAMIFFLISIVTTCLMLFCTSPPIHPRFFGIVTIVTSSLAFIMCIGFAIAVRGHYENSLTNFNKNIQAKPEIVADFVKKYYKGSLTYLDEYIKTRTHTVGNGGIVLSLMYIAAEILTLIIYFANGPHLCDNGVIIL